MVRWALPASKRAKSLKRQYPYSRYRKSGYCAYSFENDPMPTVRRAPKCLVWLTAVLASLQVLQGSPIVCHLGVCHAASESDSQVCCAKRVSQSESRRDASRGMDLDEVGVPVAPCNCPTGCWCRRPAQALLQICELMPLATGDEPVVSWSPVIDTNDSRPALAAAPPIPKSPQQVCAVLCRFLA